MKYTSNPQVHVQVHVQVPYIVLCDSLIAANPFLTVFMTVEATGGVKCSETPPTDWMCE